MSLFLLVDSVVNFQEELELRDTEKKLREELSKLEKVNLKLKTDAVEELRR